MHNMGLSIKDVDIFTDIRTFRHFFTPIGRQFWPIFDPPTLYIADIFYGQPLCSRLVRHRFLTLFPQAMINCHVINSKTIESF